MCIVNDAHEIFYENMSRVFDYLFLNYTKKNNKNRLNQRQQTTVFSVSPIILKTTGIFLFLSV